MTACSPRIPPTCGIAFKEWSGVCDALGDGRQILILRKGGIAEAPDGFTIEHRVFWLFPTHQHQSEQGLHHGPAATIAPLQLNESETIPIGLLAVVEQVRWLARIESLAALSAYHIWTEETVRRRFWYRSPGLWALALRLYSRSEPWVIAREPSYAGCRSWVTIEPPLGTVGLVPVLDDHSFRARWDEMAAAVGDLG